MQTSFRAERAVATATRVETISLKMLDLSLVVEVNGRAREIRGRVRWLKVVLAALSRRRVFYFVSVTEMQ